MVVPGFGGLADAVPDGISPPVLSGPGAAERVVRRLAWMERERIWPNGQRYLWTDGFGVVLLCSLAEALGDDSYLDRAEQVVASVDRVLGRRRGYRIGEAHDRGGQYFHYLTVWEFALGVLGGHRAGYRERGIAVVEQVHDHFMMPGRGILWKMREDLSGPEPGFGLGALDPFQSLAVYRFLDAGTGRLASQIAEVREFVDSSWRGLRITQDPGLGMMLWAASRCRGDHWADAHVARSLAVLDHMWVDPPGYFSREPGARTVRFAFTNYGVALGLQSVGAAPERVARLFGYFDSYRSHDHYDREAITHVMGCAARLPGAWLAAGGEQRTTSNERAGEGQDMTGDRT